MKPPSEWKIPEWCDGLPDSTYLCSRDIASIFGTRTEVISNFAQGRAKNNLSSVPKPDMADFRSYVPGRNAYRWRLGTIRKWIREHQ